MSHTNGIYGVQAAVEAGVDSVEHGNYIDPETIRELADSDSVWVPTLVTIRNLRGCGRYKESVLDPIIELAAKNLRLAYKYRASECGLRQEPSGAGTHLLHREARHQRGEAAPCQPPEPRFCSCLSLLHNIQNFHLNPPGLLPLLQLR